MLHILRFRIKKTINESKRLLPETKIIWSQKLPRQSRRNSHNTKAMNFAAGRINNYAGSLCCRLNGGIITYPEIVWMSLECSIMMWYIGQHLAMIFSFITYGIYFELGTFIDIIYTIRKMKRMLYTNRAKCRFLNFVAMFANENWLFVRDHLAQH